jgi:catechol 2,3-dioxygenase-like lactoylglutathione lyase family enzyme
MSVSDPFARARFFQLGYATRDPVRAKQSFSAHFGVSRFSEFNTADFAPEPDAPRLQIALAYKAGVMIEIIAPAPGHEGIYQAALRADGEAMLHHLGYLVEDEAAFEASRAAFAAQGIAVPYVRATDAGPSVFYADIRQTLGHFSEIVLPGPTGKLVFDAVPHN